MLNLFNVVKELQSIAAKADEQRLSVWVEQFKRDYPDLAEEVVYCARMDTPQTVLAYLRERDQRFALLSLIPNIEPTIQFLMNFIRERSNDDSIHPGDGNAVFANSRRRKRPTKRVHART